MLLFFDHVGEGGEAHGGEGEEEGYEGAGYVDPGGGVHEVAEPDEGCYQGGEHILDYREDGRGGAGFGSAYFHGKGVGA